jgi:hypothetical protein
VADRTAREADATHEVGSRGPPLDEEAVMPNLLIVHTQAFTGWGGSTQRLFDLAGGLAKHGWSTTVLAAKPKRKPFSNAGSPSPEDSFPGIIIGNIALGLTTATGPGSWSRASKGPT